jgi:hypothetical protein
MVFWKKKIIKGTGRHNMEGGGGPGHSDSDDIDKSFYIYWSW